MKKVVIKNMKKPEVCAQCRFYFTDWDYPSCFASGHSKGYTFNGSTQIMDDCPLEEEDIITTEELMELLTDDLIITN